MIDEVLRELSPQFSQLYAKVGRPSIAPERLLRALLLQVLYSVRSERLLMEQQGTPPTPPPDDPGNPTVNFHGERRSNATHASTTDPEARLFRKGNAHEAKLYYQGHVLMDNRQGLAVDGSLTPATGFAEREQALAMATRLPARASLGADKSYDTRDFVDALRGLAVTPHIAQNTTHRRSTLDRRTTRHPGYQTSQRHRKRIEEIFGWLKTVGLLRKARHRGAARVGWMFTFGLAVYNLVEAKHCESAGQGSLSSVWWSSRSSCWGACSASSGPASSRSSCK